MAFDSIKKKISETLGDEKRTDDVLDRAAKFASERTGGKHDDKIAQGRDFLDGKVGDEARPKDTPPPDNA
jgi:hypothetical protein